MIKKNIDYFEKIDTEEKAYWLGFIYTDGYISPKLNALRIEIKSTDYLHLQKFANIFGRKVYYANRTLGDKTFTSCYVSIYSKKIIKDLNNLGIVNKKSDKDVYNFFEYIPKRLMRHFIRGVFDGDGTIKKRW